MDSDHFGYTVKLCLENPHKIINTLVRGSLFQTRERNQKTVDYLALFRELTCGLFGLGLLGLQN